MVNVKIVFFIIMASKRVLKYLSIEETCKLIKEVEGGLKKKEAADQYGLPAATVSKIFKNNFFASELQKIDILTSVSNP